MTTRIIVNRDFKQTRLFAMLKWNDVRIGTNILPDIILSDYVPSIGIKIIYYDKEKLINFKTLLNTFQKSFKNCFVLLIDFSFQQYLDFQMSCELGLLKFLHASNDQEAIGILQELINYTLSKDKIKIQEEFFRKYQESFYEPIKIKEILKEFYGKIGASVDELNKCIEVTPSIVSLVNYHNYEKEFQTKLPKHILTSIGLLFSSSIEYIHEKETK